MASPDFDEIAWRNKVEAAKTNDLHAPHYKDGKFFNPWMPMEEKSLLQLLKWKLSPARHYTDEEKEYLPAVIPGAATRLKTMPDGDFILWVGHATFLIRLAINQEDLRNLGAGKLNVIISHNHYDHLDRKTLEALPDNTRFFVPLGMKEFLTNLGKEDVVEMDWWQTANAGRKTQIVCLPAQHWSRRIGQPANTVLWASFMIVSPRITIFFGGDSGYFIGYREISRRYPGIDYALMPVTAYHPRWFMHYSHMDIDENIDAFEDLKARYFIPTQWGTFHLGDEPAGFPGLELKRKITAEGLDPSRFLIMDIGQVLPLARKID